MRIFYVLLLFLGLSPVTEAADSPISNVNNMFQLLAGKPIKEDGKNGAPAESSTPKSSATDVIEITANDGIVSLRSQHGIPFDKWKKLTLGSAVEEKIGKPSRKSKFEIKDDRLGYMDKEYQVWYYDEPDRTTIYIFQYLLGSPAGLDDRYIITHGKATVAQLRLDK